jgi:hypothetical protein
VGRAPGLRLVVTSPVSTRRFRGFAGSAPDGLLDHR